MQSRLVVACTQRGTTVTTVTLTLGAELTRILAERVQEGLHRLAATTKRRFAAQLATQADPHGSRMGFFYTFNILTEKKKKRAHS